MIKGIIFDLDGTLLDTINDLGDSVNEALQDLNHPTHEIEAYKLKVGHGFRSLMVNSLPEGADDSEVDKCLASFLKHYDRLYMHKTAPYKGIEELLLNLEKRGIKLAVNSNKREDYTRNLIAHAFKDIEFVDVVGQRENQAKKPDPWGANYIIGKMGLTKDEVVYIGDSNTDIKTAINAGLSSIGVDWGFRGHKELEEAGADYIAYQAKDILDIIEKI